jgi:hypothetical protein
MRLDIIERHDRCRDGDITNLDGKDEVLRRMKSTVSPVF